VRGKFQILVVPGWPIISVDRLSPNALLVCRHAIALWRTGRYDYLMFTGGRAWDSCVQTRTWSEIGRAIAVSEGVDPDRILVEGISVDTYGHIGQGVGLLRMIGIMDFHLTFCTHAIHGFRIRRTARANHGLDVTIAAVPLPLTLRETLAELAYAFYHGIDPHGDGWIARRNRARRRKRAGGAQT